MSRSDVVALSVVGTAIGSSALRFREIRRPGPMAPDNAGTEPRPLRVRRVPETAGLAELLRTYLVEAVGDTFVGALHPFVVSPRTPQQVKAVLNVCAYHRLGLSVVSELPASGAKFGSNDVDVALFLGKCVPQERGSRRRGAPRQGARTAGSL
jgi:hypothetical protein